MHGSAVGAHTPSRWAAHEGQTPEHSTISRSLAGGREVMHQCLRLHGHWPPPRLEEAREVAAHGAGAVHNPRVQRPLRGLVQRGGVGVRQLGCVVGVRCPHGALDEVIPEALDQLREGDEGERGVGRPLVKVGGAASVVLAGELGHQRGRLGDGLGHEVRQCLLQGEAQHLLVRVQREEVDCKW